MKFNEYGLKVVIFLTLLLISPVTLWAAIKVEVQLSDTTLFLGDEITFQLKVDGAQQNVKLILPQMEGLSFRQLGRPSASSQTVIINGKVNSFSGLIYTLGISATRKGRYKIPGIEVEYGGKQYSSQEFEINVKESGEQTKMKITLASSKKRIYVNEPVDITLKWYIKDDVEDYSFRFPLLEDKDKLKLELSDVRQGSDITELSVDGYKIPFQKSTEILEGDVYGVYKVGFAIYPPDPGTFKVPPASVTVMIRAGTEIKRDFFGRTVRAPKLKRVFSTSKSLELEILPIPAENLPSSYSGGVGEFEIAITADSARVKVGDPIELTIRITGEGRFENIEQPILSEIREYQENFAVVDNLQPGDIKEDSIEFKQTIRPKHNGVTRIPPVEFSFFNPVAESFRSVSSNSIPLKVLSAGRVKEDEIVSYSDQPQTKIESFTRKRTGLYSNYVFEDALASKVQQGYWILFLLFSPLTYLTVLIVTHRQRRFRKDLSLGRAKSAKSKSHKRLKVAGKLIAEQGDAFYLELSGALRGYIGDKLNLGAGQLTPVDINNLIAEKKLSEESASALNSLLEKIDRCRFMQQQQAETDRKELFNGVADLMKRLGREL